MSDILLRVVDGAIILHFVLAVLCSVHLVRGDNMINKVIGLDLLGTILGILLLLLAIRKSDVFYVDLVLGIVLLGFIGTVIWMRYLSVKNGGIS